MAKVKKNAESANSIIVLSQERKSELLSQISFDADMISLTDLWKAAGSPKNKRPIDWGKIESTLQLIETLGVMIQSGSDPLWATRRGGANPGTYAHKSIALAYAKYLDPKLHIAVNEIFFEIVEEEKNPESAKTINTLAKSKIISLICNAYQSLRRANNARLFGRVIFCPKMKCKNTMGLVTPVPRVNAPAALVVISSGKALSPFLFFN